MKRKMEIGKPPTERRRSAAPALDTRSAREIAQLVNREDAKVAGAVGRALPAIARAIDAIAGALARGGRLIYVGAGTSGRIAALDAVECPPTFGTSPRSVQYVIAGGRRALGAATEVSEDSAARARRDLAKKRLTRNDVVVGVAASGRTPYTVAALGVARRRGACTVAVTCQSGSPLARAAHIAIVTAVGPEVVAGSTRMKAGTAQKMVLNLLSTAAMARLGYVYGNLMVNVHTRNRKLVERGVAILQQAADVPRNSAQRALRVAGMSVPVALVMLKTGLGRAAAQRRLRQARGHVRRALEEQ